MAKGSSYNDFDHISGWAYDSKRWSILTGKIVGSYASRLERSGLLEAVLATQRGITLNKQIYIAMLESFCPATNTCLSPNGEYGFSLSEMTHISALLSFGEIYKEYIPCNEELELIRGAEPDLYRIVAELFLHFTIIAKEKPVHAKGVLIQQWTSHFFNIIEFSQAQAEIESNEKSLRYKTRTPLTKAVIEAQARKDSISLEDLLVPESEEPGLRALRADGHAMLRETFLAAYLVAWLHRCIFPSKNPRLLDPSLFLVAARMALGTRFALCPAMVARLCTGLRDHVKHLGSEKYKLKAYPAHFFYSWYVMHCPSLHPPPAPPAHRSEAFLGRLAVSSFKNLSLKEAREKIRFHGNWHLGSLPHFNDEGMMTDDSSLAGVKKMNDAAFIWFINIRPSTLVY